MRNKDLLGCSTRKMRAFNVLGNIPYQGNTEEEFIDRRTETLKKGKEQIW